jgi:hypothetical protein
MSQFACGHAAAMAVDRTLHASEEALQIRREVALLTAGKDKPYALGMASALLAKHGNFIGSELVDGRLYRPSRSSFDPPPRADARIAKFLEAAFIVSSGHAQRRSKNPASWAWTSISDRTLLSPS